jgi:hypothetical protein
VISFKNSGPSFTCLAWCHFRYLIASVISGNHRSISVELFWNAGRICIGSRDVSFSTVIAGHCVGIREITEGTWLAGRPYPSFMDYDLGFFDQDENRVEPGPNPFVPEV